MKFRKNKVLNMILILSIILLLFTPIGRYMRGFAGRLLSSGAAKVKSGLGLSVENYNWQLKDTDGNTFHFEEAKGKVVFIDFWATWCPPCIAEMPSLQRLYDTYGDKVLFLFVPQDDEQKVDAFIEKKGYDIPIYFSGSEVPKLLSSKTLPTTYVLDKEGRIVIARTGATDWDSVEVHQVLNGLLGE